MLQLLNQCHKPGYSSTLALFLVVFSCSTFAYDGSSSSCNVLRLDVSSLLIASEDEVGGAVRTGSVEACLDLRPNLSLSYFDYRSSLDVRVPLDEDLYQLNVSKNRQAAQAHFVHGDLSIRATYDGRYFEPELEFGSPMEKGGKWRFFQVVEPFEYQMVTKLGEDEISFGSRVEHQKTGLLWQGSDYSWQFISNEGGNVKGYQWEFSGVPLKKSLRVEVGFGKDRFHAEGVVYYNGGDRGLATNRFNQSYLDLTLGLLMDNSESSLQLGYRSLSLEHFGALDLTDMDDLGDLAGLFWISQLQAEADLYHVVHQYKRNLTRWRFQFESGLYYSEFDGQAALRKRLPLVVFPVKVDESNIDNGQITLGRLGLELGYGWSESLDIRAAFEQWIPVQASIETGNSDSTQNTADNEYSGASVFSGFKRPPGSQITVGFRYYW